MRLLIIILWLCLMPLPLEATTYYVKTAANGGSDGAAGTSWATAWATVGKVNSTISEGDSVYFGTGTWYESTIEPPTGGDTDDWTAYLDSTGDSTTANNTRISSGTLLNGTWVQRGATNIWAHPFSITEYGCCMTQNDSMLWYDASIGEMELGGMYEDAANDSIYAWCYNNSNPNTQTMIAAARTTFALDIAPSCRAVSFVGINLSHGSHTVVMCRRSDGTDGPDFISFDHCWISFSGGHEGENTGVFYPDQGQVDDTTEYSNDITFTNCVLGPSMGEFRDYTNNLCNVVTYGQHHMRFTDCMFRGVGIGLYIKDKQEAQARNGISVVGCTFKDCTQAAVKWTCHANADTVAGNFMIGCGTGIWCYGSASAPFGGHLFIGHNTIYNCDDTGLKFSDNSDAGVCFGTGNVVKYNIWSNFDTQMFIGLEIYDTYCTTFWNNITWDYNLYYANTGTNQFGTAHLPCGSSGDWDHWHTDCGLDPNGSNSTDPDFHDPGNGDYSRDTYDLISDSIYIYPYWFVTEGAWTPRGYTEPPEPPAEETIHVPFHY